MAFSYPRPGFGGDGPHLQHSFSDTIVLQRDIDSSRSLYASMFLRSYILRILALSTLQNWFCAAWRFMCLYSTWSKGGLCAPRPSSISLHFVLFCLINADLSVPIWYKIVWSGSAQSDSNQGTLDAEMGRASLLFHTPPDLFGLGRFSCPGGEPHEWFVLMFKLEFSGPPH